MTILDLIKKSAVMLNIRQVLDDDNIDNVDHSNEFEVLENNFTINRLFEFAKLVVNEVYSYIPNKRQITLKSKDKKLNLASISNLVKVTSVKKDNKYVKYSANEKVVTVDEDGEYTVCYNSCPYIIGLMDGLQINNGEINEDIFVYGLNSYYCLATGLFAEFNIYNSQYTDRLSQIKNLKLFAMPCRSWND